MSEYKIRPVWRRDDADAEQQAIAFWNETKILPAAIDPVKRAKQLISIAHRDDDLAGVATATIEELAFLRARFAMFRCAVAQPYRMSKLAVELTVSAKSLLEEWSREHPEERVQGMGIVLEANLGEKARKPVWPASGLTLVHYTQQGLQIRVAWFEHARVE